ncbi:MAG: hypothetical protein ACK40M_01550 [Flavobacteriales bacterium]
MDDELVTKDHPLVAKGVAGIPGIFSSRYSVNEKQNYEYRPIVLLTFAIEHQFFGANPAVSHFVNILIYALCGIVLFQLLLRVFNQFHWILPAATVMVFMLHPIHTEVVASLKNRDEMLSFLFAISAVLTLLNYLSDKKIKWILLVVLFVILSIWSKRSSLTMIAIFPLIVMYMNRNSTNSKVILKRVAVGFVLLFVSFFLMRLLMVNMLEPANFERTAYFFENPFYQTKPGLIERIPMVFYTAFFYVQKLIFPYPLAVYYGYNTVPVVGWSDPIAWISMLIIVGVSLLALLKWKTYSPWVFGWLYFLLAISMFSNVVPAVGIVAERFAFSASVGMSIILAWSMLLLLKIDWKSNQMITWPVNKAVALPLLVIFLISSGWVINRNTHWKSSASIYKHDILVVPNSAKLNSLLGSLYAEQINNARVGRISLTAEQLAVKADSAIFYFSKALEIYPDYIAANNNIGTVYFNSKDNVRKARSHFKRATELDSNYAQAFFNLASIYDFDKNVYSNAVRALNRVSSEDTIIFNNKELAHVEFEAIELFENAWRVERNLIFTVNGLFSSPSKEVLDKKIAELPAIVTKNVNYFFSTNQFKPNSDSLSKSLISNLNLYLNSQISGQPDQVLKRSTFLFLGVPIARYIIPKGVPSGYNNWTEWAMSKERIVKDSMLISLSIALQKNPKMTIAFDKLNNAYYDFQMYDSVIALNKRMEPNRDFQGEQININIANAYFMKNMNSEGIDYLIKASNIDNAILTNLSVIYNHQAFAKNTGTANLMASWISQKRLELYRIYDLIGLKYNEIADQQNAQIYFNLAAQYK